MRDGRIGTKKSRRRLNKGIVSATTVIDGRSMRLDLDLADRFERTQHAQIE